MFQFLRGFVLVAAALLATCEMSFAEEDPFFGKRHYAGLSRGGKLR
jgi:hypothetical protein